MKSRRILGIDPGISNTGFAVIQHDGSQYHLLECDLVKTDKQQMLTLASRIIRTQLTSHHIADAVLCAIAGLLR